MGRNLVLKDVFNAPVPVSEVCKVLDAYVAAADRKNIRDVAKFTNQVEAVKKAAETDAEGGMTRNYFAEIAVWSARTLGLMIEKGRQEGWVKPESGGGKGSNQYKKAEKEQPLTDSTVALTLEEIITHASAPRNYALQCKRLAAVDKKTIQNYLKECRSNPDKEITKAGCLMIAQRDERLVKSTPAKIRKETLGVQHCPIDELEIADSSVDLIFTDPPYDRESIGLYDKLMLTAIRVLVPGGSCLCYCAHLFIPEIVEFAKEAGLRFYWVCACLHNKKALLARSGIRAGWKPILWFTKGERFDTSAIVHDCTLEAQEKEHHEWQQSIDQACRYIEPLSRPGHVVLDPFCGSGTTLVAAKRLGRKWIGCDIDADAVQVARERIDDDEPNS